MIAIPTQLLPEDLVIPGPQETRRELRGQTMGTSWCVTLYAPPTSSTTALQGLIEQQLLRLVAQMSHWDGTSQLSRYNASPPGDWVQLEPEFFTVLSEALSIARLSSGAFDPALADAVNHWGFGPAGPLECPPASPAPRDGHWSAIRLDPIGRRALQPGHVHLDLSAIAKGFAVDHIAEALRRSGVSSFLVEIGGELRAHGINPNHQPWWVEIEAPPGCPFHPRLALSGFAVATSGDYRRHYSHHGRRYSHTLLPATRAPLDEPPASVTVLHSSAMAADAWATALMVQGPAAGLVLCETHSLAALYLLREGPAWKALPSSAFAALLE